MQARHQVSRPCALLIATAATLLHVSCNAGTASSPTTGDGDGPTPDAGSPEPEPDGSAPELPDAGPVPPDAKPIVILLIGDGMGRAHVEAAARERSLRMNELPHVGEVVTSSLSGITESAASATAMATGFLT